MEKKIIGIHGFARSGKDTIADYIVDNYGFKKIAFADSLREALLTLNPYVPIEHGSFKPLKVIIEDLGWEVAKIKYPIIRQYMQTFGSDVCRKIFDEDIWVRLALKKTDDVSRTVFSDVRFENEVENLRKRNAILIKVTRLGVNSVNDHESDKGLPDESFDYVVKNDSSLLSLYTNVDHLISKILK